MQCQKRRSNDTIGSVLMIFWRRPCDSKCNACDFEIGEEGDGGRENECALRGEGG